MGVDSTTRIVHWEPSRNLHKRGSTNLPTDKKNIVRLAPPRAVEVEMDKRTSRQAELNSKSPRGRLQLLESEEGVEPNIPELLEKK
jgi:hypothetical protein